MPYTVKCYGSFNPYYVKLYGDFGHGLKVIHRRAINENDDTRDEELPDNLEDELPETTPVEPTSTTCLMLAWKPQSRRRKNAKRRYYLLIEFQVCEASSEVYVYKLFSSKHKQTVEDSLQEVKSTLLPIVNVPLSEKLLKMLILPKPKSLDELHKVMSDYIMDTVPRSMKDWNNLLESTTNERSLKRHTSEVTTIGILKPSIDKGNDLVVGDPITGTSLIHLAVQHSHKRVRETLEYLSRSLTEKGFLEYINRSNKDGFSTVLNSRRRSLAVSIKQQSTSSLDDTSEKNLSDKPRPRSRSVLKVYPFELGSVTPLMLAVRKNCVRSVHYLLVAGADPNYQDPIKGMTALHIAAIICNVSIMKLLLSFNGDLTLKDGEDKTPIHVVKEREGEKAEECLLVMEKIADLRQKVKTATAVQITVADDKEEDTSVNELTITATVHSTTMEDVSIENEEVHSKPTPAHGQSNDGISLLSFDGGGTRGCISAYMLYLIEQRMRTLANDPELHISSYFNWYTGTSIGSFFALSMSHKKASTHNLMKAIVNNRNQILTGHRIYSSSALENFGKSEIGEEDIRSITDPKVLVIAVKADRDPPSLAFISNYKDESEDERGSWKTWEAVRASTAAPTFFKSFEEKYIDGSILAVVPTLHAMSDIQDDGRRLDIVVSLGTGETKSDRPLSLDLKMPKFPRFASTVRSNINYFQSLSTLLKANTSFTEGADHNARAWCKMINAQYHRLSPSLSKLLPIDTVEEKEFVLMFYETYVYCLENESEVNNIAQTLLELGPKH